MDVTERLLSRLANGNAHQTERKNLAEEAQAELKDILKRQPYKGKGEREKREGLLYACDLVAIATIEHYFTDYTEYDRDTIRDRCVKELPFVFLPRTCGSYLTWPDGKVGKVTEAEGIGARANIYDYFRNPPKEGARFFAINPSDGTIAEDIKAADLIMSAEPDIVILKYYPETGMSLLFKKDAAHPYLVALDYNNSTLEWEWAEEFDTKEAASAYAEENYRRLQGVSSCATY